MYIGVGGTFDGADIVRLRRPDGSRGRIAAITIAVVRLAVNGQCAEITMSCGTECECERSKKAGREVHIRRIVDALLEYTKEGDIKERLYTEAA